MFVSVGGSPGHHKDLLGRLDLRKAPHRVPCNEESSGFNTTIVTCEP